MRSGRICCRWRREGFDLAEMSFPTVNAGCVKVQTNFYSVPLPGGRRVEAKAYASTVEIWHEGDWWPATNAATAASSRCWIWNITWTC